MSQNKFTAAATAAIFVTLTLIFFWKILLTNLILSGVDVFLYFYPYKAYTTEALRQGRLPLWNPHLFMGAPLLANSQIGVLYPLNWLFLWLDAPKQVAWSIGLHIALAGILMTAFARISLRLSWPAALVAALLFAFGGYLGAQVEHVNQLQAAAWMPLLFLLYDLGLHRPRCWLWLLLLAATVALILLAGHTQTAFITMVGLGLYGLWQAISTYATWRAAGNNSTSNSKLKTQYSKLIIASLYRHLWPIAAASIFAAALAAIQLLPTAELSAQSIRSQGLTFQEVVSFSLNPTTLHYSLLPPYRVDLTQILGEAFGEWIAYLGVSGAMLALLGVFSAIWQPAARRFLFLGLVGLILSFGVFLGPLYLFDVLIGIDSDTFHILARWSHPYYLLYRLAPGFSLFRVPARWLLLYAFSSATLAGFGFEALGQPATLRQQFITARNWLRTHPKWRTILLVVPTLSLIGLLIWKTPPIFTLILWLIFGMITCAIIYYALRTSHYALRIAIVLILFVELLWASQSLNYNQPTAPQAYDSMRNAIAFLLAADPPPNAAPPDRFLSLSGITYDPGDLADLQNIFGGSLSEKALYNLIIATKEKEVLFFNLPMVYGLHSVDGYDGGILPLTKFITLQELFLPPDELSLDGRLREKLRTVPDNRLLSMLNTRWIITDKQFDAWIDGIFYDLQFPARLAPSQTISTTDIPTFPPTAIGIVSHLENAANLPDGTPIANIIVTFGDGQQETISLAAGRDTAEGNYTAEVAHPQAKIGVAWPYAAAGVDYIAVYPLSTSQQIVEIALEAVLPNGQFVLRGLSLIHQPTTTSRSVMLSTEGDYQQVHSGDVKVYENRAALPRAFMVHRAEIVKNNDQAIALMKDPQFDPTQTVVLLPEGDKQITAVPGLAESPPSIPPKGGEDLSSSGELEGGNQLIPGIAAQIGLISTGESSLQDSATFVSYLPERVELAVTLESDGWLVLTDTHYPGWRATVDGQPVDIRQADILFRAVPVPTGQHTVVFEFKPESFRRGSIISGTTLLILIVGLTISSKSNSSR